MIKSITITLLLAIILAACDITTNNQEVIILNSTNRIIEVQIYNTWSGDTIATWNLQKGINKSNLDKDNLYGLYAKEFPEKTFYTHNNTTITFENNEIVFDGINQDVNAHFLWSQKILTGESYTIFNWNENSNKLKCLIDWKVFDTLLLKLTEDPNYKIEKGILNSSYLNSYPAAYALIDKIFENNEIALVQKIQQLSKDIINSGIKTQTKNNFLSHYLLPQKVSLRNDSILLLSEKYFPGIYPELKTKYETLEANAKLKKGMMFPDFNSEEKTITIKEITNGYAYTLIDFWATWCIPCIKQMPDINQYAYNMENKIQFISLSVDNKRDFNKWQKITNKYNSIKHFWLSDTTSIREDLGVKGLPRMILLDKNGMVIDPNFPHFYEPLAHLWVKSLINMNYNKVAEIPENN